MVDEILLVPNNFRPHTNLRIMDGFFVLTPTGVKYKEPSVCKFLNEEEKEYLMKFTSICCRVILSVELICKE